MQRENDGRITLEYDDEHDAAVDAADLGHDIEEDQRYTALAHFLESSDAPVTLPMPESAALEDAFKLAVSMGDMSAFSPKERLFIRHWLEQIGVEIG